MQSSTAPLAVAPATAPAATSLLCHAPKSDRMDAIIRGITLPRSLQNPGASFASIHPYRDRMIMVTQTDENQQKIADFLDNLRAARGLTIRIQTRFIQAPANFDIGRDLSAGGGVAGAFLNDEAVNNLLRRVQDSKEASQIAAPRHAHRTTMASAPPSRSVRTSPMSPTSVPAARRKISIPPSSTPASSSTARPQSAPITSTSRFRLSPNRSTFSKCATSPRRAIRKSLLNCRSPQTGNMRRRYRCRTMRRSCSMCPARNTCRQGSDRRGEAISFSHVLLLTTAKDS